MADTIIQDDSRFGISALERESRSIALNGEIMINRETSQVLIKTPIKGDIISFDYLNRMNSHIYNAATNCQLLDFYGDMCGVELTNIELPEVINEDTTILDAPLEIFSTTKLKKFMISIDLDCVEMSNILDKPIEKECVISINITLKSDNEIKTATIALPLSQFNNNVINSISYVTSTNDNFTVTIDSIKIKRDASIDPTRQLKFVLYNIIVVKGGDN